MRSRLGFVVPHIPAVYYAVFPGASGDYASTPDNAAFSALGDFSIVARLSADDWTPATLQVIASQYNSTGNQRSWFFAFLATGELRLAVSTDGSSISGSATSTAAPSFTDATTYWVLVTRTSSSGDVKFYTAADTGSSTPPAIGSFSQLGSTVTGMPTGTLFDSSARLIFATIEPGTGNLFDGNAYRFALYSGIYGGGSETLLRDFNPSDATSVVSTSWTAGTTGETWTLNGSVALAAV